jgi:energy-coupling factor transporter ATP-binding protein EcfA2
MLWVCCACAPARAGTHDLPEGHAHGRAVRRRRRATRADLEDLVVRLGNEYGSTIVFVTHDIDEAVYVADRVLVMGAGPGRLVADIPVPLGAGRDQVDTKLDPGFAELRSEVFRLVMRPKRAEERTQHVPEAVGSLRG